MLTLICGVPNAGKTTYSKRYKDVLHLDEIGTIDKVIKIVEQIKDDVVIEGYFGKVWERVKIRSAYKGYAKCIFLNTTIEESIKREDRGRYNCILCRAHNLFEQPTYNEGWDEIVIIRGKNE